MLKVGRISLFSLVMLLALLWQIGSASASTGWSVVPSVNPAGDDILTSVAATSVSDAWAVGGADLGYTPQTLIEHWNGSAWSVVSSPNPGPSTFIRLSGVAAISSSNAWTVGYYQDNSGSIVTLAEHWNGSVWSVVTSPNPAGFMANELFAVAARSANDIWAVGTSQTNTNVTQTLTEHWNGSQWSVIPSVNPGATFSALRGVAVVSATNAWAVGNYTNQQGASQTLMEQWNGSKWNVVPGANPAASNYLFGVSRVPGSSNRWAVGMYSNGNASQPLTEKWNGTSWKIVSSPTIKSNSNVLNAVTVISSNNIWAVGQAGTPTGSVSRGADGANSGPAGKTLIMHWNGTGWSVVSSPNPGLANNGLSGVSGVAGTSHVWAVGADSGNTPPVQTLIEYHQ